MHRNHWNTVLMQAHFQRSCAAAAASAASKAQQKYISNTFATKLVSGFASESLQVTYIASMQALQQ